MKKLDDILSLIENTLIVVLTLAGLAMAFLQVILRYVFNTGIHWLEAGLVTALIWAMLLGSVRAVRDGLHPRVDLLPLIVPPKVRALLNFISLGITFLLVGYFFLDSIYYASFIDTINVLHPEFGFKQLYPFLIIPIVTALMTLRYAMLAWGLWFNPSAEDIEENYRELLKKNSVKEQVKK